MRRAFTILVLAVAILFSLLAVAAVSAAAERAPAKPLETVEWPIINVADGDTIETRIPNVPEVLQRVYIRVYGIDTPEKGHYAKCAEENDLALQATTLARTTIAGAKVIQFQLKGWDKYGGRIDAIVLVDGVDLAQVLINAGLANSYFGKAKKAWCP